MRIYNGTNSQLTLPFSGSNEKITIPAHSVSGNILPSTDFLSLLVTSFNYDEIALVVSGPFEINMCAGVSGAVGFVVQSIEEAIEKFTPKKEEKGCNECECSNDTINSNCYTADEVKENCKNAKVEIVCNGMNGDVTNNDDSTEEKPSESVVKKERKKKEE